MQCICVPNTSDLDSETIVTRVQIKKLTVNFAEY